MQEKGVQLLQELTDGIGAGDFASAENIPDKYTYAHLWALFRYVDVLDGGRTLYGQIFDLVIQSGKLAVQGKARKGEKIKFAGISASRSVAREKCHIFRLS